MAPYFVAAKFCHEAPSRAVGCALGLASGLASGARSDWRRDWRLAFAFESLLNCTARLLGGLRALLVEGDGVGTGVGVCWGGALLTRVRVCAIGACVFGCGR